MKIMNYIVGLVFAVVLSGCSFTGKIDKQAALGSVSSGVAGTYYAKLPYQNDHLVIDLLLEDNHIYSMIGYVDKIKKEQYEVGVWQQQGDKLTLIPKKDKKPTKEQTKKQTKKEVKKQVTKQNKKAIGIQIKDFLVKDNNQLQLLDTTGKPYKKIEYTFKKK